LLGAADFTQLSAPAVRQGDKREGMSARGRSTEG
jgi:hypothetical protein